MARKKPSYLTHHKNPVANFFRFLWLSTIKTCAHFFFRGQLKWASKKPQSWSEVSVILILNHTSLFEFVFAVTLPFSFFWQLSRRLVIAVASKTMDKPFYRRLFTSLAPKIVTLTRKRDESWQTFLDCLSPRDICIFLPEGRMKRKSGLDSFGKPMTVKGGVYDLLQKFRSEKMVIVYSKGLHHVMAPEDKFPRPFKKIEAQVEFLDVNSYLTKFAQEKDPKSSIMHDLEKRRDRFCH